MLTNDNFLVRSTNVNEANKYKSIISDVLSDLRLLPNIDKLFVEIIPEDSIFYIVALLKNSESTVSISDVSSIHFDFRGDKSFIVFDIEREKYIPKLTSYLWKLFSRDKVVQIDRWKIEVDIKDKNIDLDSIKKYVLENQGLELQKNMLEFSTRSTPEGFKVRYHIMLDNNKFLFISSENPINKDLINNVSCKLNNIILEDYNERNNI